MHLQILVALPVGDVRVEAGELEALDGGEDLDEVLAQHRAHLTVGLQVAERAVERLRQLFEGFVLLAGPVDRGPERGAGLDAEPPMSLRRTKAVRSSRPQDMLEGAKVWGFRRR